MTSPLPPLHERRRPTRRVAAGLAAAVMASLAAIALVHASPPVASPTAFELQGPGKNVHAPCFWANPTDPGGSLLFATAKDSGLVEVFNATTGTLVGTLPGFGKPNSCTVEGDLLLTTDETAHDVVVHHVPDLTLVRTFGQDMIVPRGIDVLTRPDGQRHVYVTDGGNATVHVYDFATGAPVRSFATSFGLGIEPLLADDRYQRIFIAREDATTGPRGIGIFSTQGTFLGEVEAAAFSRYPEGMALYACGDGGYLIAADQLTTATEFEVFDRVTLQHLGTFEIEDGAGDFTDSTDGVAILQSPLPGFPNGVLAACDGCGATLPEEIDVIGWERIAAVLGLNVCPGGAAPNCTTTPCIQRQLVSADASVSSSVPDTNLGSDPYVRVDADPLDQTLLRFEVPDLTGFDLRQAVVRLTVDVAKGSSSVSGGTLYLASGAWDEGTVTFNTRPQPVGQPLGSAGAVTEGQVVDFDVSPVMHGPGTYDFILLSASRDGARYRSREAGQSPPTLLLTLHQSSAPQVQITSPADGALVASGALLTLSATASDPEDGNLSSAIRWRSDLDGALGVGSPRTVTLRPGLHTITAEVTDQAHLGASASVRVSVGSAPVVTISEPADGTSVPGGTPLVLWGRAVDAEDGDLSAGLRWESDRDGALGTGTALGVTLSEGTHRLTASVADSGGGVGRAEITVIVTPAPPAVTIGSPVDGTTVVAGESVTLRGSALDFGDGDLGSRLTWQSSLQGPLGTGASLLVASLPVGTHVITASVTDSAGLTGQASVTLRVAPATLAVEAAADTYVGSDVPDQNFGHDTTLQADHSPDRQSFLRFIVSGTQGLRIDQASLRLTVSSTTSSESDSGGTLYTISDTGWQEETLTYRTRPPIDGPALGTLGPVAKGQVVAFDVSSAVPGEGTLTFALATASSNAVKYRSRETTSGRPTLVLTLHSQPIANAAPTVRITAPTDGSIVGYGTPVLFSATAADDQDGDLSSLITWSSSLEGPLGTGPFIVKSLGAGTHVVTAAVIDSAGLTGSQQVSVTVTPPLPGSNTAPRVSITGPPDGRTFSAVDPIPFAGTADDLEDGVLSNRLTWTSDREGAIGSGASFTRALGAGTHRITASAVDTGGLGATASILVNVVPPTVLEFAPAADTYVDAANPNTNFGTSKQLRVDTDPVRNSYLRFVVAGIGTRRVAQAVLRLQVDTASGSDSDSGGTVHRISDDTWQERTVTYASRPPVDGPVLSAVGRVALGQVVDFDVTAAVTADGTYDLALVGTSSNVVYYRSREAAAGAPKLILTLGSYGPVVTIGSPSAQAALFVDDPITFTGTATDVEDGDLSGSLEWTSSQDGWLGTGASFSRTLSFGTHTLTAATTDSAGHLGQAQMTIQVGSANARPTVTITAPPDGSAVPAGTLVTLGATASDPEDGSLSDQIRWTSTRDGALGGGPELTVQLTEGTHRITASATDASGAVGSATITLIVLPTPPVVTITAPADGTTVPVGTSITYSGTATDATDGDLSMALQWTSDRDGPIGVGPSFATTKLSVGTHAITALAIDSGDLVGQAQRTVVVQPRNQPPVVTIVAPANGTALLTGQPVVLSATALDPEDGNLDAVVRWTSSRDGTLGSGTTLTLSTLSAGSHTLTASATDSGGVSGSASIAVTLSSPVLTLTVGTDTFVDANAPSQAYGSSTELVADASPVREIFLRFPVSGVAPFTVGQALLRLTVASSSGAQSNSGGTVHPISDNSWSGSTTYDTRPAVDGPALGTQGAVSVNQTVDFDATPAVVGDGTYNFAVVTASGDAVKYRSRESSTGKPQLVITRRQELGPVVTTLAPLSGARVPHGTAVTFSATATDAEDGDLTGQIAWSSDLDGALGTGGTLTLSQLSIGTHTITASVSDSDLNPARALLTLNVTPGEVGYRDFAYGSTVEQNLDKATAQKPESKLWYHDGSWWATLFRPDAGAYHIHRLDFATQTWIDSGVLVDERSKSRQDVLAEGDRLYIASRFAGTPAQNRLLRYTYDPGARIYRLDSGFPVNISGGGTESVTLAKDSTGTLWIAYTLNGQVFVDRSLDSDTAWGSPFLLPVAEGTTVSSDDIAGVQSLPGAIGVFWSNQLTDAFYFAVHPDGAPATDPSAWQLETVAQGGSVADDHFNMKLAADGRLFVAAKTSATALEETHIGLFVRSPAGVWSSLYRVVDRASNPTRPLCLLDEVARRVYVFYSVKQAAIYYKASDMDAVAFPPGDGTPFIASDSTGELNNPTGTKQNVSPSTGLVVEASGSQTYWHNVIPPQP